MPKTPEWDYDPETIGQLVEWFSVAEDHIHESDSMKDYVGSRWMFHIDRIAQEQGIPTGWLAYMIQSLVLEARIGEQA